MAGFLSNVYTRPLCPLDGKFDMSRYLLLDGAEERFAEFQGFFADPGAWTAGQVVVVTGEKGYGKTSLIQRCAAWLVAAAAEAGHCHVIPVDLSDEEWPSDELLEDRMNRTLDRILAKLGTRLIDKDHIRIGNRKGAADKFHELGEILSTRKVRLADEDLPLGVVVLLDGYPSPDTVEAFYRITKKGMFFFAEMFEEEDRRRAREFASAPWRRGAAYRALELGALKPGDPDRFVEWVNSLNRNWPTVLPEISDFFNRNFIPQGAGMGKLAKVFWGALDIAIEQNASELTDGHIAAYYAKSVNDPG